MEEDLIKSFEKTIKSNYDLKSNIENIAIDNIDALSGLPIFSTIRSALKLTRNFQLYRLAKKILRFIFLTKETTVAEREKFLNELSAKNKESASETLLDILDKIDNINKVDVIAKLMVAKIRGEISIENFVRLSIVLQRIPYLDLEALKKYVEDFYEEGSTDVLFSAGVLSNSIIGGGEEDGNKYCLNSIGALMLKHGLGCNVNVPLQNHTSMQWNTPKGEYEPFVVKKG